MLPRSRLRWPPLRLRQLPLSSQVFFRLPSIGVRSLMIFLWIWSILFFLCQRINWHGPPSSSEGSGIPLSDTLFTDLFIFSFDLSINENIIMVSFQRLLHRSSFFVWWLMVLSKRNYFAFQGALTPVLFFAIHCFPKYYIQNVVWPWYNISDFLQFWNANLPLSQITPSYIVGLLEQCWYCSCKDMIMDGSSMARRS